MPNRKQAHSWIPPGKKALVRLKDGEMFVDKFRRNEKGKLYFDSRTVALKDLQMMSIYREMPERDERVNNAVKDLDLPKKDKEILRHRIKKQLNRLQLKTENK